MIFDIKIKWPWPFKPKKSSYEIFEGSLDKCPQCGGDADNGHDRCMPPSPYYCSKCQAKIENEADSFFDTIKVKTKKILPELKSDIRVSPTKFGGCGICCYCGKWQHNLSFHEARCPQRVELGGRGRG